MNKKIIALIVLVILGLVVVIAYGNERHTLPKGTACTQDAMICPDGSAVGRTGPLCQFAACPSAPAATLLSDAYPLYAGATWGQPSASTLEGMTGAMASSEKIGGITDIASITTPFDAYYASKLSALGWSPDLSLDAGGPGSAETGYKKGMARIVFGYATDFLGTKPGQPVSCPCSLAFTVWSGLAAVPAYENVSFTIDNISVTLADGTSVVSDGPGSASSTTTLYFGNEATGDLNADGTDDAAFLVTQSGGGSGTFYYVVAALKNTDGTYSGTNAILLGDRIAPQSTEIKSGKITVNYAERKPTDPMTTAPSVGVSRYFEIKSGTLVEVKN